MQDYPKIKKAPDVDFNALIEDFFSFQMLPEFRSLATFPILFSLIKPEERRSGISKNRITQLLRNLGFQGYEGKCRAEGCDFYINTNNFRNHVHWHLHGEFACDDCRLAFNGLHYLTNHRKGKKHNEVISSNKLLGVQIPSKKKTKRSTKKSKKGKSPKPSYASDDYESDFLQDLNTLITGEPCSYLDCDHIFTSNSDKKSHYALHEEIS